MNGSLPRLEARFNYIPINALQLVMNFPTDTVEEDMTLVLDMILSLRSLVASNQERLYVCVRRLCGCVLTCLMAQ